MTDAKERAVAQWTADPCGPLAATTSELLARRRAYEPFLAEALDYPSACGLELLDVGCGQGIDLCEFALAGATVTGVDLTPRHVSLARWHLNDLGLDGEVVEGDAEALPFRDCSFDRVVSNGVLHHTPDMPAAFKEIRRVLRPGGLATVVVYNRDSGFYWLEQLLRFGVFHGMLLRERSIAGLLSRNIERSSIGARPLVRVYTRRRLEAMMADAGFRGVMVTASPFRADQTVWTRHLPARVRATLALRRFGWYLAARGVK